MTQFIFLKLLKMVRADVAFVALFRTLFSLTPVLIRNVGIIPVAMAIYKMNR